MAVMSIRRFITATLAVTAILMVAPRPAAAHTDLEYSEPAEGEVVTRPVEAVIFGFATSVEPYLAGYSLTAFGGTQLAIGSITQTSATTVRVEPVEPITQPVAATWAIVGDDGHPRSGSVVLAVDAPATAPSVTTTPPASTMTEPTPLTSAPVIPAEPAEPAENAASVTTTAAPTPAPPPATAVPFEEQVAALQAETERDGRAIDWIVGVLRWLGYGSVVVAIGVSAVAGGGIASEATWTVARPWVRWVAGLSGLVAVAAIGGQLAALTGRTDDLVAIGRWPDVLDGRFATGTGARLAGAVAVVAASGARPHRRVLGAGCALMAFGLVFSGHSASEGAWSVQFAGALVHLLAISIWMGGLVAVVVIAHRLGGPALATAAGRFRRAATVAMLAVAATGAGLSARRLDGVAELWTTTYGRYLMVKVGLVLTVVLIGAVHHVRSVPRITASAGDNAALFQRLAWAELMVFAAVLAATAALVLQVR